MIRLLRCARDEVRVGAYFQVRPMRVTRAGLKTRPYDMVKYEKG